MDCRDQPGKADGGILETSWDESRILLTEDWDFGELAIRFQRPALGIVIIAIPQLARHIDKIVQGLVPSFGEELRDGLIGKLTIIEAGRVRQRDLGQTDRR